jgi:hypothetical protein
MKTISVKLSEVVDAELTALAGQRRARKTSRVREALKLYFSRGTDPSPASFLAQAKDLAGCLKGPADLSVNKDHLRGYGQ